MQNFPLRKYAVSRAALLRSIERSVTFRNVQRLQIGLACSKKWPFIFFTAAAEIVKASSHGKKVLRSRCAQLKLS